MPPLPNGRTGLPTPPFTPVSASAYFDRIAAWLPSPATDSDLAYLRRHCGHLKRSDDPEGDDLGAGDPRGTRALCYRGRIYLQRLVLLQPDHDALKWIVRRGAHVTQVEIAVDFAFASPRKRDGAQAFVEEHFVRPWHPRASPVHYVGSGRKPAKEVDRRRLPGDTHYDAGRRGSSFIKVYGEHYGRKDGLLDIVHIEWTANDRRALRRAGIVDARDLVDFDFVGFWQKHLLLAAVDEEKLGRLFLNRLRGEKARTPRRKTTGAGRPTFNEDRYVGEALRKRLDIFERHSVPIQTLVDMYRALRIERAIVRFDTEPWVRLLLLSN